MFRYFVLTVFLAAAAIEWARAEPETDPRYAEAYALLGLESDGTLQEEPTLESDKGVALLVELDAEGHASASNTLGVIYLNGMFGIPVDAGRALLYYGRAYEAGKGPVRQIAAYNLATVIAQDAVYGSDDWRRVEELAQIAAENEDLYAEARGLIGRAMVLGPGEDRYQDALPFLLDAVDAGSTSLAAHWLLARGYSSGWFGEASEEKACPHFVTVAEGGGDAAFWNAGMCYLNGTGVQKDSVQAYAWVRDAADAGFQSGMVSRAVMLAQGDGTTQDLKAAAEWYDRAMRIEGNLQAHAMRGLGGMHYSGELGAESDPVLGRALLELAAEQGDPFASQFITQVIVSSVLLRREEIDQLKAKYARELNLLHED